MFVNLRDFYPQIYTADLFCELPEEIVAAIKQSIRENHAYNERRRVHRAYYSLSSIPEKELIFFVASPEEIFEQEWMRRMLYTAIRQLPSKQASRLYAHYFLGLTKSEIARMEGVAPGTVKQSIEQALKNLKKYLLGTLKNGQ
ncbi:MAG TPA: sigma-70 family RNA polymerase sigma factor [Firmicutes bacterium]|nr:sigma-70 family RNA polymerase sigma factor [Bacillota bacterium]